MNNDDQKKNIILNDEEKSLLLNHNYDGIEEFDYPLPRWWVATFIGGIVFAVIYIFYYEYMGAKSIQKKFLEDIAKVETIRKESSSKLDEFDGDGYNAFLALKNSKETSQKVFSEYCVSCHQEGGRGDIGPNLTDSYWINLKTVNTQSLYKIIKSGVEENGMPAWGELLTKEELFAAVKFVMDIKDTNIKDGKEPQGEKIE